MQFEEMFSTIIQTIGWTLDIAGVLAIVVGILFASVVALRRFLRKPDGHTLFRWYRQSLARSILIGLEFLVAGDLIRTVAGGLSLENVAILGGIVLIRIVLGMSLEAEINGRWPKLWNLFSRPKPLKLPKR